MPYEIKREKDQWCVYNKNTGENKGCSDSEDMAKRHMAALYVHERKSPLALSMTITEVKKANGRIRWRGRLNTGQVDTQNEKFDRSFFDDLVGNFWSAQEAISKGEALPAGMNPPQLDVAHLSFYYEMIDKGLRSKARAGWPTRLWIDGEALMADGYYDDSPLGRASAKAGMRDDKSRPRLSIAVYPDWERVEVDDKTGAMIYKGGRGKAWLDHVAQTMYPVNVGTDIRAEADMDMKATTVLEDAKAVLQDDELVDELGKPLKTKSETPVPDGALVKAKREDVSQADEERAVKEYGDVTYADEENKKYPIDTEEHIRAAWSYINMPKNSAKYPDGGKAIKARIAAAWKRIIDKEGPPEAQKSEATMDEKETPAVEGTPAEKPIEAVKSETVDLKPINDKLDMLAKALTTLAQSLPTAMQNAASEAVKSLQAEIETLKKSDAEKVKSALDNSGDFLAAFRLHNPRTAPDNVVPADNVAKAEPTQTQQFSGIWAVVAEAAQAQKPGG